MPAVPAPVAARLKREDCARTKHDSLFSPWKVLVGPSDWDDHSAGKEGVQRYRILNLPDNFPGLYELGVARVSDEGVRARSRKHGSDGVVVVYLGQADNVRARLQQYGRTGSHLDTGNSLPSVGKAETSTLAAGPGLFREVFSRGYSVTFRCTMMGNKHEAEKTEAKLLRVFDYAWNKLQNGACRREEILLKLEQENHRLSLLSRIRHFRQKMFGEKAGIKIYRSGSVDVSPGIVKNTLPRVRTFGGFRPRLVDPGDNLDPAIEHHTSGNKQPHRRRSEGYKVKKIDVTKRRTVPIRDLNSVCGVMLEDGSSCLESPMQGRKRCELHKGRRIARHPKVSSRSYTCHVSIPVDESIPGLTENGSKTNEAKQTIGELPMTVKSRQKNSFEAKEVKSGEAIIDDRRWGTSGDADIHVTKMNDGAVCSGKVILENGKFQLQGGWKASQFESSELTDLPQDNDRLDRKTGEQLCGENTYDAKSQSQEDQPSGRIWFELLKTQKPGSVPSSRGRGVTGDAAAICGVLTDNGCCKMIPMVGRKRCEEHRGVTVTDSSSAACLGSSGWPSICGARASDGSPCKSQPIAGRKRCALHKGQRACCAAPVN